MRRLLSSVLAITATVAYIISSDLGLQRRIWGNQDGSLLASLVKNPTPSESESPDGGGIAASKIDASADVLPRVFIMTKTSPTGFYQERITQVRRTWLRDALEDPRVEVKFFAGNTSDAPISTIENDATNNLNNPTPFVEGVSDAEQNDSVFSSLMVSIPCEEGYKKLTCKTFAAIRYFLQQRLESNSAGPPPSFFCNFDDDTYVLIPSLLRTLSEYQQKAPWYGKNLYIGRPTWRHGKQMGPDHVHFHTGGAWCISSDLVRRGEQHLESMLHSTFPEDIAVGYFVQEKLNVTLVVDSRFHSHYKRVGDKQELVPRDQISKQVAFAYNTKRRNYDPGFANVPRLFSKDEDPLLFRSLRCFLLRERTEQQNDTKARAEYASECNVTVSFNATVGVAGE